MRRGPLAAIALVAGCLQPGSHVCDGGWVCPDKLACAEAPVYCGPPDQVAKCQGGSNFDPCSYGEALAGSCFGGVCQACAPDREGCPTHGWTAMADPTGGADLGGVFAPAAADAYAVGARGTLIHYDGVRWSPVVTTPPIPASLNLVAIAGTSADDFYVLSDLPGAMNVLHVTQRSEVAFEPVTADGYKAVATPAPGDAIIVGAGGAIERHSGTGWSPMTSGTGFELDAVHAPSATNVFAAGANGHVAHFDGMSWLTTQPITDTAFHTVDLTGVFAVGSQAYAVGVKVSTTVPTVVHCNGTCGGATPAWQAVTINGIVNPVIMHAVWGSSASDLYAVGDSGLILHSTDGDHWDALAMLPGTSDLYAIAGASADEVFVVGKNGTIWRYWGP